MSTVPHADQHQFESRFGRIAAAAAIGAALLPIVSSIVLNAALGDVGNGDRDLLVAFERQPAGVLVAAIAQAVGTFLVAVVLYFLFRATRYRMAALPAAALPLAIVGSLLAGLSGAGPLLVLVEVGKDFATSGDRSEQRAEDLIRDGAYSTVQYVSYAARAVLGAAFALIALYAMRAGLLSRFMGYIGIIIGVLYVLSVLLGGPSFILLFWLPALALLFLNRWPGGRGPAWDAGEAIPWPGAAEQRRALERKRAEDEDEVVPTAGGANGSGPASVDPDTPRAATPRKRKRRRR